MLDTRYDYTPKFCNIFCNFQSTLCDTAWVIVVFSDIDLWHHKVGFSAIENEISYKFCGTEILIKLKFYFF